MKPCVLFAASIFDSSKLNVIREFFLMFKTHFPDADFFIGMNYGCMPAVESVIKEYGLNCYFGRVENESLYTKTDASAYQMALKMLKLSKKTYDIYWFSHTKGGVNERDDIRKMYFNEMFTKRSEIEKLFTDYPMLGSWGIRGNYTNSMGVKWKDYNVDSCIPICGNVKIPPFNYTHVNFSYIETLYVLKKEPTEAYINLLPDEFFLKKLDPWYFETVPAWAPSRCGYFPYVKQKRCFWNTYDLLTATKEWIEENQLTTLTPYLDIP